MTSLIHGSPPGCDGAIHRIHRMPILVLMPHSRCNCRCLMCDIWKANRVGHELSREQLAAHVDDYRRLGVRWVALSGGEAMLHRNLWSVCALFKELPARITLLSSGLLLERFAAEIVHGCDDVIVSLDGSRPVHDAIRGVPHAFDRLCSGVAALKSLRSTFRVTARCVVQRSNCAELPAIIRAARDMNLDQISFVAADVSSQAFNRPEGWNDDRIAGVALDLAQVESFRDVIEDVIRGHASELASGFIAESAEKLRRLPQYFAALHGRAEFPLPVCNAPWISTVIEADGTVRPCFFHPPLGNIHNQPLATILNSAAAVAFREQLDVQRDSTCRKCVCTLHLAAGEIEQIPG